MQVVDVHVVQLHRCCSWIDGMAFQGRVHRYTARGFPRHLGGEGVAGTPGACSQVFCHPIKCMLMRSYRQRHVRYTIVRTTTTTFNIPVKPQPQKKEHQQPQHGHRHRRIVQQVFFPKSPVPFVCCKSLCAMLGKRSLGFDVAGVPSGKRLRHNVADLFLSNSVSATRAASLFCDAAAAGAEGVGDLQRVGAPKHHHRNLLKKLLKGSKWPGLYF